MSVNVQYRGLSQLIGLLAARLTELASYIKSQPVIGPTLATKKASVY